MRKEDISLVAQLLSSMKDAVAKLDEAQRKKDLPNIASAKKEILNLQQQINKSI